jgi:hypothetical protein
MTRIAGIARWSAIAALWLTAVVSGGAEAEEPYKAEIDALRQSLAKYQDVYTAVREGYFSTVGCVHYSGETREGHMEYPKGAMGIHFVNSALFGPELDPMKPQILLYEPVGKTLRLVGVEWIVPLKSGITERPVVFGQPFQGPMEGHVPLLPQGFVHYDLHAWLFKDNPLGLFSPTNPEVKCDGYDFELLEEPTKIVEHP